MHYVDILLIDGWMDGWMDGRTDGRMGGLMDRDYSEHPLLIDIT